MNDFIYDVIRWLIMTPLKLIIELCFWICAIGFIKEMSRAV